MLPQQCRRAAAASAAALRSCASASSATPRAAIYRTHGDPSTVLHVEPIKLPERPAPGSVLLRFLAAPVNPSDLNQIEGKYPVQPPLPAVAGNEGVAEVLAVGSSVASLSPGDWVLPPAGRLGTWATHGVCAAEALQRCPSGLDVPQAATLSVNPLTALRLLDDFVALRTGDVIALDAANSAVGRATLQLAAVRRLRCLAFVRDRPDFDALAEELRLLGASEVLCSGSGRARRAAEQLPPARLALNAVGGESAGELASMLGPGGVLVTYGGMSKRPLLLSTSSFIFKGLTARGFWLTEWVKSAPPEVRAEALETLAAMMRAGQLRPSPTLEVPLDNVTTALRGAQAGGRKLLLRM